MLGRRSFLITCGWMVTAPARAKDRPFMATSNRPQVQPADPVPMQMESTVLQIEGWDTPLKSAGSQVWISINQSWRTAWR